MPIPRMVRLNGKLMTRTSVAVKINAVDRILGVDSVDWSDEVEAALVPQMNDGGRPAGIAIGNYSCDATLGVYADEAALVEAAILQGNPTAAFNLTAAIFQMVITFREDVRFRTIIWENCRVKGRPGRTVGNDGSTLVAQFAIQPTAISENGITLVNNLPAL